MVTLNVQHPSRRWVEIVVNNGLVAISPDNPTRTLQLRSRSGEILEIDQSRALAGEVDDSAGRPIDQDTRCNTELFFRPDGSDTSYCLGYLISVREG